MVGENARLRRYVVIMLVSGVHGLILFILVAPHARREPPDEADVPIAISLFLPPPIEAPPPHPRTRHPKSAVATPSVPSATADSSAPIAPVADAPKPVDWLAEAQAVAGAFAAKRGAADAGGAAARAGTASSAASPHHAGESYALSTGQKIVWTSDSCYLISDPPDLATPNAFAHLAQARVGCVTAPSTPKGDLFKQSPAYQKYHPDN